ncbi:MAG: FUN14 domain-containing protein [Methylomonas sp.]
MNENGSHSLPTSDFFSSPFLVGNVGAPFLLGMAVGYFAKKMLKLALFVGGAIVVALFLSEYYGVITINEVALESAAGAAAETAKQSGSFLIDRLSHFASRGVSGSAGFYVGFKLG